MTKPHLLIAVLCICAAASAQPYPFQDKSLSTIEETDPITIIK